MFVYGGGTRVEPDGRGMGTARHGLAEHVGGIDARIQDEPAIARMVTAVHRNPGEVDQRVGVLQFAGPWANDAPVPINLSDSRSRSFRRTGQGHHIMVAIGEEPLASTCPRKPEPPANMILCLFIFWGKSSRHFEKCGGVMTMPVFSTTAPDIAPGKRPGGRQTLANLFLGERNFGREFRRHERAW